MNIFDEYVKKYDLTINRLNYKYYHSYRVMDNMELLAKNMNFPIKDVELAKCIGLFHDIGRFEQYKQIQSFNDKLFDHGDYGATLVKEKDFLKSFEIDKDDYDVVYKAIKYHNKLELPDDMSKRELLFSKLIRDADKLDIIYALTNKKLRSHILEDDCQISKKINDEFINRITINKDDRKSKNDSLVIIFSFVYDINFYVTLYIIKKYNYYQKIYDRLKNKEIFKTYIEYVNKYLDERVD